MDFTTIGTLHSYARIKNLQFAAKHKIKTGQSIVGAGGKLNLGLLGKPSSSFLDQMMKTQNQKADAASKKRLAAIKRKLMNGKRLSNEEMGFLLKNDSKLYRKAQKAQEARDELKAALSQAKTKDEARKALMHAKGGTRRGKVRQRRRFCIGRERRRTRGRRRIDSERRNV